MKLLKVWFSILLLVMMNSLALNVAAKDVTSAGSLADLNKMLASAVQDSDEPLDPEDAFKVSTSTSGDGYVQINWSIAKDYYLYRDRVEAKLVSGDATLGELITDEGEMNNDPIFGNVEVYYHQGGAKVALHDFTGDAEVEFTYQGCAGQFGLCYPPQKHKVKVSSANFGQAEASTPLPAEASSSASELSESDRITSTLQNSSMWVVVITFFIFGLLLSFTPCVFPMIPILSSIIVGQGGENLSTRRAFTMSLVFVLAMAITYTFAGVLAGLFGQNLQAAFQNPWILGTFALVFVALAMSMFGFFELQLPSSLQSKITNISNKQKGGTLTGVAIMGFLSALIVGPCVAPPLAGALIYIGQTGDALLGGMALFAMSLGMGVPLLLLGTSAGKLLPRAGGWMNVVKAVFGIMLLAVAIWMVGRVIPDVVELSLWAVLIIISAIYMGALEPIGDKSNWHKLWKGLGVILLAYGLVLVIGIAGGTRDLLQPLKVFQGGGSGAVVEAKLEFKQVKNLAELEAELAKGKPVMLDFFAEWCVSCHEMERYTFSDPAVQAALQNVTLLQADVTANNADDKAMMQKMQIVGPPAILFFNQEGVEQRGQRVVGFKNAQDFLELVNKALD